MVAVEFVDRLLYLVECRALDASAENAGWRWRRRGAARGKGYRQRACDKAWDQRRELAAGCAVMMVSDRSPPFSEATFRIGVSRVDLATVAGTFEVGFPAGGRATIAAVACVAHSTRLIISQTLALYTPEPSAQVSDFPQGRGETP